MSVVGAGAAGAVGVGAVRGVGVGAVGAVCDPCVFVPRALSVSEPSALW